MEVLPRMHAEPIPTQMTLGSESDTSTAPTEADSRYLSAALAQLTPASSVFHTPPPVLPMK